MKKSSGRKRLFLVASVILLGICIWKMVRLSSHVSCTQGVPLSKSLYSEKDSVIDAISLSYLVYGCEACENLSGTVSELLDHHEMGIITENFGIKRQNEKKPTTAFLDTSDFIRKQVGHFRFLNDLSDKGSSFYGAAFCDDEKKCIWIAYSGAVSFRDCLACAQLVVGPSLSAQEKAAFDLYERVQACDQVKNQSYQVVLTGHSLGGALASMVSSVSGCTAVTINGADGVAIDKIQDMLGEKTIDYQITNYMTSPQNGKVLVMDAVQRLMFLGSYTKVNYEVYAQNELTIDTHSVFSFIDLSDGVINPKLPNSMESNRKIGHLSKKAIFVYKINS